MIHIDSELDILCECSCGEVQKVKIDLFGVEIQKTEQTVNERLIDLGWNPITHECKKCQKKI